MADGRLTQISIRTRTTTATAEARLTQLAVRTRTTSSSEPARVSQLSVRAYSPVGNAPGRVSQLSVRTYSNKPTTARFTQISVRVYNLQPPPTPPGTPGTITVTKSTVPAGHPRRFTFAAVGLTPTIFTLAHGESITFTGLLPGVYSITEIAEDGWSAALVVSSGDDPGTIHVSEGVNLTVTATNTQALLVTGEACPAPAPTVVVPKAACPAPNSA